MKTIYKKIELIETIKNNSNKFDDNYWTIVKE